MGYTHYWRQHRSFTTSEWSTLRDYAQKVEDAARAQGIRVSVWHDAESITIEGDDDHGYESCIIDRTPSARPAWDDEDPSKGRFYCCKTALCPYDPVVVTIIHAAAVLAPDAITELSDGDAESGAMMFHFTSTVAPPSRTFTERQGHGAQMVGTAAARGIVDAAMGILKAMEHDYGMWTLAQARELRRLWTEAHALRRMLA